jgi:CO/xanthine dehydrogenase Mo-binding subunit
MDGAAPAIANAVSHATGVNITKIPITPESLMEQMQMENAGG